jgi:polyisoprenoid-binding protein YceI
MNVAIAALALALLACGNSSNSSNSSTQAPPTTAPAAPDRIVVLGRHRAIDPEGQATDPVVVRFTKFRVTKTHFDPAHLDGGTATLELDLASLATGSSERDDDLRSPTFLDIAHFATATIDIAHVVHQTGETYAADATVACHGATRTFPVTFTVVEHAADHIRIKGEHTFSRLDFGVGADPATDPTQQVDTPLTIQLALTLPVKV